MRSLRNEIDWYRALTLSERAFSLLREGPPVEVDAQRAAEALDVWRAQTPFQKEELLRQRLAMDGLSLEDFTALLGESGDGLRERAAAKTRPVNAGNLRAIAPAAKAASGKASR